MRITFFGSRGSFAYDQIGGTDSFFRRLGGELVKRHHHVEFVHYGCPRIRNSSTNVGITILEMRRFNDALGHLSNSDGPIIVNAIRAVDRPGFIAFRYHNRDRLKFYMTYSLFSDTLFGRSKHFLEAALYPFNGGCICMSNRLVKHVRKCHNRAHLLLPPVSGEYFRSPCEKRTEGKLIAAYIGRLEPGKGACEAIAILDKLSQNDVVDARVIAYYFNGAAGIEPLRERLIHNSKIRYQETTHRSWTPETEQKLASELRDIDILLLPYRTVSSSIDTPLLLLEGMASLCCCVIRPDGNIAQIYGESPFVVDSLSSDDFVDKTCELIRGIDMKSIIAERERLLSLRDALEFDTPTVADGLLAILRRDK